MMIIPAIDIRGGKCVRLVGGDYTKETVYDTDPVFVAKQFESQGAKRLHIVDLDGARKGNMINNKIVKKIVQSVKIPVQVGGGIRTESTVELLLEFGVKKVILGTIAIENTPLLKKLLKKYPSQLIVSLDARGELLMSNGWTNQTKKLLFKQVQILSAYGVKEFIYTDVLRDGLLSSPNIKKISELLTTTNVPIIIAGGVSSTFDIVRLEKIGINAVIVGKAIYERKVQL